MWRHPNKILIRLSCLIYFFALNAHTMGTYVPPTVTITNGTLEGKFIFTRLDREICAYEGIPYAAPPVGELRFKPPQPASAWNGKRLAVQVPQMCTQKDAFIHMFFVMGGEDCLYLNVYTPIYENNSPIRSYSYPVMVWFHGGGWIHGAGHIYQPTHLLDHDAILVTVNYRLGALGFLSTEDLECPGNLGLKDQQQALRWVQENIAYFHGDPKLVTIFGESVGGASVHYHMISPLSKGLFHRAISQSGTSYSPWALMPPGSAKEKAKMLGNHLNCTTNNSKKLIECLRTKSAKQITDANDIFQTEQIVAYCPTIPYRPVIEPEHSGAFLTEDPQISVRKGRIADVPWLTGVNSEEGSIVVPIIYRRNMVPLLNNEFMKYAPLTLLYEEKYQLVNQELVDNITDGIRRYYFAKSNGQINESDENARLNVINMFSDAWFIHSTYTAVRDFIANQTSPLYFYYFTYKGRSSFSSTSGDDLRSYGVSHADELFYLFPFSRDLYKMELTNDDANIADLLTMLWYNFAKFGNPTPDETKVISFKWTPSIRNFLKYLHINRRNTKIESEFLIERMLFWDAVEDQINKKNFKAL